MDESNLWIEKYRPETLSSIPAQKSVVEDLKGFVERGALPHMLFAGPPGSGRTMTALAVARELFGDGYNRYFLRINCSDEGVMVRRKPLPGEGGGEIQRAKRRARGAGSRKRLRIREEILNHVSGPPMGDAPHKILYLLDFDSEDSQTQNALRRPMENHSDNCRFILAAENTSNIIDPIQSRCATFRFGRPSDEQIMEMLRKIGENEDVELGRDGAEAITRISKGNVGLAVNLFQAASSIGEMVDENAVYDASETARPEEVREMMKLALGGKFGDARKNLQNLLIKRGTEPESLLRQIQEEVPNLDVPEPMQVKLIERMGGFDFDLVQGGNERIQLENTLIHLARLGNRLRT